ncbi:MAG: hypothetical protein R2911_11170 [Caldilineaceae bacterium]
MKRFWQRKKSNLFRLMKLAAWTSYGDADILTFRKAYAAVLLKRRGHVIPSPAELSAD